MWAAVSFTHVKGVRLLPGQPHPRGSIEGEVQTFGLGRRATTVLGVRTDFRGPDVALLYACKVVGIGPDVVRLSGLERVGEAWVRQEWICSLKLRPNVVPGEPSRDRLP